MATNSYTPSEDVEIQDDDLSLTDQFLEFINDSASWMIELLSTEEFRLGALVFVVAIAFSMVATEYSKNFTAGWKHKKNFTLAFSFLMACGFVVVLLPSAIDVQDRIRFTLAITAGFASPLGWWVWDRFVLPRLPSKVKHD